MKLRHYISLTIILITIFDSPSVYAQKLTDSYIQVLKDDRRGPYKDIKWFCEDGTVREARDPCPEPMEGVQHARYKDNIQAYADDDHIFIDQILIGTEKQDFWDGNNQQSRLKQYQITNFLYDADNGWILEKGKNYRGAKQIEDEQEWGQEFLEWATNSDRRIKENFLLMRLAAEDIPHGEDNRVSQRVRAYSKLLADANSDFMNLRIKIHNNPSSDDIQASKDWVNDQNLSAKEQEYYDALIANMEVLHKPFDVRDLEKYIRYLPKKSTLSNEMKAYSELVDGASSILRVSETARMLKVIRSNIYDTKWKEARVKMIDLSNHLEDILLQDLAEYNTTTLPEIRDKVCYLTDALYGAGYLESWEYDQVKYDIDWLQGGSVSLEDLDDYRYALNKLVQWSTQMVQSLYVEQLSTFHEFEPKVDGFTDDKIRSSIILPMGRTVEQLNSLFNNTSKAPSSIMGDTEVSGLQGLNPGLAQGELVVLATIPEGTDLDVNKIYAFDRPPSDLKPVAGILNVKEGNPVSHVQLLARNLAIPNALISEKVLKDLKKYEGKKIMYAVSPKGTVQVKLAADMTKSEQDLFGSKERKLEKLLIATDKLVLDPDSLLDMSQIGAESSGRWCGPKAANLGQLKQMFPSQVVDGVVIPFGVFKDHMMQNIPDVGETYWSYLTRIFHNEKEMIANGESSKEIECVTLQELGILRSYIVEMPLKKSFEKELESRFNSIFGKRIGNIPVFLRSDTNMEDLPEFTGAGLNLTLFNVLARQEILDGIKKVWASPYTERSYQWRQQYLQNPEDVYPSILIIPSVNVDRSGVIITKGVSRGGEGDISISFSRGVGGAVDGQSAESYVIYDRGYTELISPGRETKYRTIPPSGGSQVEVASFVDPVLSINQRKELKDIAIKISDQMDEVTGGHGPYDIELGIKDDKIWLFQVRPFVENKSAVGSEYLRSLDPVFADKSVALDI